MIDPLFWKDKRVFLTGHTGFKGSWLSIWLNLLGARVRGYSLSPLKPVSLFNVSKLETIIDSCFGDIRDQKLLNDKIKEFDPDILIHMAAQSLVRHSYISPIETYEVNVIGTANVLEVARNCSSLKAIINITSDKCYDNDGRQQGYKENDPLGGKDPYSSSKGCAELVTAAYRSSFLIDKKIGLASARAGNVVGGGDWADDRLIPDILKFFEKNEPAVIRNPKAIRPWQHVLEPLSGYLVISQKLYENPKKYSDSWNFGPNENGVKSVQWILDRMIELWPGNSWILDEKKNPNEAEILNLDISKASKLLDWKPTWDLKITLKNTLRWYRQWSKGADMRKICQDEIIYYTYEMNK